MPGGCLQRIAEFFWGGEGGLIFFFAAEMSTKEGNFTGKALSRQGKRRLGGTVGVSWGLGVLLEGLFEVLGMPKRPQRDPRKDCQTPRDTSEETAEETQGREAPETSWRP